MLLVILIGLVRLASGCLWEPVYGPFESVDQCIAEQYLGLENCLECCAGNRSCRYNCWREYAGFLPWCEGLQRGPRSICFRRRYGPFQSCAECIEGQRPALDQCVTCCPEPWLTPLDDCNRDCIDDFVDAAIWCSAYPGECYPPE
jgi:hypothetical protein